MNIDISVWISFYVVTLQVPWSQSANIFLLALTCILLVASGVNADPDIGKGSYGGEHSHLDADDPDFSGVVDFSNAIPGK